MEPLLNQQEISELLAAIRQGKVSLDTSDTMDIPSCEDVNLFHLARPAAEKLKVPNFDIIVDNFARDYSVSLSNQLQRTISITRVKLQTIEFQEFFEGLPNPGAIGMLEMPPLKQSALILFNPALSYTLIEIMLGASSESDTLHLNRVPSTIELNVLKVILDLACKDVDKAFAPLTTLATSLVKVESSPRLMSVTEPDSEVITCTLQVNIGKDTGEIRLVFPFSSLEVLYDDFKNLLRIDSSSSITWYDTLAEEVKKMTTQIKAQSGVIQMTIGDVLKMEVGDILEIDYDPNNPLKVLVEDQPKFHAIPGTHNGQKAISLTGVIR